jgi:preprotein translocase subunit YajC
MLASLLLLAQQTTQEQAPGWSQFIIFLPIAVLFYFMLVRPAQRQEKERTAMVSSLKKNDRVLTSSGIYGTVLSIKDNEDEVALKIDENSPVRLRVTKSSIVRKLTAADEEKDKEEG